MTNHGVWPLPTGAGLAQMDIQVFRVISVVPAQRWSKPRGPYRWARIICVGSGGGGGSGRKGAAGTVRGGGGAGGGGGWTELVLPYEECPSYLAILVGVGPAGGVGRTSDDQDGATGGGGQPTFVTALSGPYPDPKWNASAGFNPYEIARAGGGNNGGGGTNAGGGAGSGAVTSMGLGTAGGAASGTGGIGVAGGNPTLGNLQILAALGGGSGGGIPVGDTNSVGGNGATFTLAGGQASTGAGGTGSAKDGLEGYGWGSEIPLRGGTGGGGGASSVNPAVAGGTGGDGAYPGGGGGGGGAALNTTTPSSGAGGRGGDGVVTIICY